MKSSRVIYLCHPVSGDVENNLARARRWLRWVYDTQPGVTVLCQWILDCEVLDDDNPEHRATGLQHDFTIIERCDETWAVGGRVSGGMGMEIEHGLRHGVPFLDLSKMGDEPPSEPIELPPLQWPKQERKHERRESPGCRS
jgi:hypothetical protein